MKVSRALLPLLFLVPTGLKAQELAGTVVESESRQPVAAALVQLLPALTDSILASSVTNDQGRFRFSRVSAATYRARVLRIGFRPWTSDPIAYDPSHPAELNLAIPAVPVVLSDITVETKSPCRESPASDQRMALLWDDARTALALLGVGSGETVMEFRSTLTRRMVDPGDHLVSENSMLAFGRGAWPVASQSADSLARLGFVQARDTLLGPVYYGPDVSVFFSDAFLGTHCFRLVAGSDAGLLGLGFEPHKNRRLPDIEGVLWLDRDHNRLRRLEYHYTSLWAWVPRGSTGGTLEFTFLGDGRPVLTGWSIRAPVARVTDWSEGTRVRDTSTRPFFGNGRVLLQGFREEQGQVNDIRLPDGTVLWKRE